MSRQRMQVKPQSGGRFSRLLHKVLVVPTHSLACAYSAKIPLWVLRLQLMASYNWTTRTPVLNYRLTTKWSEGARVKHKETVSRWSCAQLGGRRRCFCTSIRLHLTAIVPSSIYAYISLLSCNPQASKQASQHICTHVHARSHGSCAVPTG
jgi:hypothetical protein